MVKTLGYFWVFIAIKYQIVLPSISAILIQAPYTYILDYFNNLSVFKMKH